MITNETRRISSMVNAITRNGPMTISELSNATGWSHETIRAQIEKSSAKFERVEEEQSICGGFAAPKFILSASELAFTEDELDKQTDEMYRDLAWWPKPDQVVISTITEMVKSAARDNREAA